MVIVEIRRDRRRHRVAPIPGSDSAIPSGDWTRAWHLHSPNASYPYIAAAGEVKTKPTQHSVRELMEIGIQPDILICRTKSGSCRMTSSEERSPSFATWNSAQLWKVGTFQQFMRFHLSSMSKGWMSGSCTDLGCWAGRLPIYRPGARWCNASSRRPIRSRSPWSASTPNW